jgi:anti-anti-sigma factor
MKLALASGWDVNVERGPGWLFVRVPSPEGLAGEETKLAERLWELLQQSFFRRLVVELDDMPRLSSYVVGQLVLLHKRISTQGGIMRICGVSPECQEVLRLHRLNDRLHPFRDREEAVLGRPGKPR